MRICVAKKHLLMASAMMLCLPMVACNSSSGNGSGGLSEKDAAVAASVAIAMSNNADGMVNDPNASEPKLAGQYAKNAADCPGNGYITTSESVVSGASVGLDVVDYAGDVELNEVEADCVYQDSGFYVESRGYMRSGSSPDSTVNFVEATSGSGDSADDGPYISIMDMGTSNMEMEAQMYAHFCVGCPEQGGGLNSELYLFGDVKMYFDQPDQDPIDMHARWGRSTSDRVHVTSEDLGSDTAAYTITGFMAFETNQSDCDFAADFETIDPLVMQNVSTEQPQTAGGELHITPDNGGDVLEVQYHADGSITVNGTTFSADELEGLAEDCTAGMDASA